MELNISMQTGSDVYGILRTDKNLPICEKVVNIRRIFYVWNSRIYRK